MQMVTRPPPFMYSVTTLVWCICNFVLIGLAYYGVRHSTAQNNGKHPSFPGTYTAATAHTNKGQVTPASFSFNPNCASSPPCTVIRFLTHGSSCLTEAAAKSSEKSLNLLPHWNQVHNGAGFVQTWCCPCSVGTATPILHSFSCLLPLHVQCTLVMVHSN